MQAIRQAKEGFDGRRGGNSSFGARGKFRLDQLVAPDKDSRKEAKRLGLLQSDDEFGDGDNSGDQGGDGADEMDDEEALAEQIKARHLGPQMLTQDVSSSSESEEETPMTEGIFLNVPCHPSVAIQCGHDSMPHCPFLVPQEQSKESEDEDDAEDQRRAKRMEKRFKMRRALSGMDDSRSRNRFLEEDEESQTMLGMLKVCMRPHRPYLEAYPPDLRPALIGHLSSFACSPRHTSDKTHSPLLGSSGKAQWCGTAVCGLSRAKATWAVVHQGHPVTRNTRAPSAAFLDKAANEAPLEGPVRTERVPS